MDRYPVSQDNSQLLREAKIGFSIVLLVVSAVGFWGYNTYCKYQTQIPEHVANAPLAQMIGPDEYLRSLEGRSPRIARTEVGSPRPVAKLIDPFSDGANRQVAFNQPIVDQKTVRTQPQSRLAGPTKALRSSQDLPKSDIETTASSLLSKMNETMQRVQELNPIGRSSQAVPAQRVDVLKGDDEPSGDQFKPLNQPRPTTASMISSDDNTNTENTATDLSKRFVNAEPSPLVTSRPSQREGDNVVATQTTTANREFKPQDSKLQDSKLQDFKPQDFKPQDFKPQDSEPREFKPQDSTLNVLAPRELKPLQPTRDQGFEPTVEPQSLRDSTIQGGSQNAELREIDRLATEDIVVEIEPPIQTQTTQTTQKAASENEIASEINEASDSDYITRNGDSWWSIATEFYGDGRYFRALYQHNAKMLQVSEQLVSGTRVATPDLNFLHENYGQHCPADKLEASTARRHSYTTAQGDTLFGIARKITGQASKYLEIYQLNRDRLPARMNHLTRLPADIELVLPR